MTTDSFTLELELDTGNQPAWTEHPGGLLFESPELSISVSGRDDVGHGFGLSEVVVIVIEVAKGASSALVAAAVKASIKAVIRRVKGATSGESASGSVDDVVRIVESERAVGHDPNRASDAR